MHLLEVKDLKVLYGKAIALNGMDLYLNSEELVGVVGPNGAGKTTLLKAISGIVPVEGEDYWFSSGFGWRVNPFTGLDEYHKGLDICGQEGTPIIAPADGRVFAEAYDKYMGNYLHIDHGWGCTTSYAHLAGFSVTVGEEVSRGQIIGSMGSTGRTTGPHLHYSIAIKNKAVNPLDYILNNKFARNVRRW